MPPVALAPRMLGAGRLCLAARAVGIGGRLRLAERHVLHEGASLRKRINPPPLRQPTLESPRRPSRRVSTRGEWKPRFETFPRIRGFEPFTGSKQTNINIATISRL